MSTAPAVAEREVVSKNGTSTRVVRRERKRTLRLERFLSLISPLLLLVLWELLVRRNVLDVRFFPMPSQVLATAWDLVVNGTLFEHIRVSLTRAVVGFAMGAIPAVIVGLSMGLFRLVRAAVWPVVGALYPIPTIAILPLIMLIFGLGEMSKWVIIAISVFFPVLVNSMAGVMQIDKIYHDVGKNFGASRVNYYRTIALPGALPLVLTGMRMAWAIALLLIVAAEFVAAKAGIGFLIWQSWQTFRVEEMYVGIIVLALFGYLSFLIIDKLTELLVPWKPPQ